MHRLSQTMWIPMIISPSSPSSHVVSQVPCLPPVPRFYGLTPLSSLTTNRLCCRILWTRPPSLTRFWLSTTSSPPMFADFYELPSTPERTPTPMHLSSASDVSLARYLVFPAAELERLRHSCREMLKFIALQRRRAVAQAPPLAPPNSHYHVVATASIDPYSRRCLSLSYNYTLQSACARIPNL
ncbi:hypothetical protein AURDEDRAFT_163278 [Auricularia subglabra TFB-10046 SS5]|nr:hypothetical protein AURDEDRAFT_163278 [Auricularia subglabra TFB-10046 SS5]